MFNNGVDHEWDRNDTEDEEENERDKSVELVSAVRPKAHFVEEPSHVDKRCGDFSDGEIHAEEVTASFIQTARDAESTKDVMGK